MALPGSTQIILDGGLGVTTPASSIAHCIGVCESGSQNVPTLISNQRQLKETFGTYGPLIDAVGLILAQSGGPVVVTRTLESTPATYDGGATGNMVASAGAGADNEINLAVATTAPKAAFELKVTIVVGGALAATTFTYSFDDGKTTSPVLAAGASILLGASGVTLEFEAGASAAYVAGALYTSVVAPAHYTVGDLATAFVQTDASLLDWDYFVFAGEADTAANAATIFATISAKMDALINSDAYFRAIMGAGLGTAAAALTAWAAIVGSRVAVVFGGARVSPVFPTTGRGLPVLPALNFAAMRAAGNVMSTDLAQTFGAASVGPLSGASDLLHNEFTANAGLDAKKVGTQRTYSNLAGVFMTNVWLKSPDGSDFQYWQHGRMMDEACKAVSKKHTQLISSSVITKADGTGSLTEASALAIEAFVQRELDVVIGSALRLVGPNAIDGTTGHVSDIKYQVDRTNNVLSTNELIATVAIVPRGYLKTLTATLSYSLST